MNVVSLLYARVSYFFKVFKKVKPNVIVTIGSFSTDAELLNMVRYPPPIMLVLFCSVISSNCSEETFTVSLKYNMRVPLLTSRSK